MKFAPIAMDRIANPGNVQIHHCIKLSMPSDTIAPHSGVGGGVPRPRKLSVEKNNIWLPISSVATMITAPIELGKIYFTRILKFDAPTARDAST